MMLYSYIQCIYIYIHHLAMTNIAMENHHAIKFGKPSIESISIRAMALPWRTVSHKQRVSGELTFCYGKIHHFIAGKIHYFYGHFPLLFVCSPEGIPFITTKSSRDQRKNMNAQKLQLHIFPAPAPG